MSVRPLDNRLLTKRIEEQEVVPGGIVIPDTAKEKPQQGQTVAVGNGRRLKDGAIIPLDVHVGDHVIFGKFAGTDVVLDGEDYLILREDGISAIVEPAAEGRKAA
jgi:chaperonin GroES